MWMAEKPRLDAFRRAIVDEPDRVRAALEDPASSPSSGRSDSHDSLKRVPPGLPADHPMADLFRYKDVVFGRRLSDDEVCSPDLPDILADAYAAAHAGLPASSPRLARLTRSSRACGSGPRSGSIGRPGRPCATPCLAVERAGWDSLWVDDHLLADEGDSDRRQARGLDHPRGPRRPDRARPARACWSRANTFRQPGPDRQARHDARPPVGRPGVLGLGGGWFEREHDAFGIDFGAGFGERLDRLDEAVGLIRRLLDGETVTPRRAGSTGCATRSASHDRSRRGCRSSSVAPDRPRRCGRPPAYADLWNGYGTRTRIAEASTRSCASAAPRSAGRSTAIERTVTDPRGHPRHATEAEAAWATIAARPRPGGRDRRGRDGARADVGGPPDDVADVLRRLPADRRRRGHRRLPRPVRPRDHRAHRRGPGGARER